MIHMPPPESNEIFPQLSYRMMTGTGQRGDGEHYLLDFEVKISAAYCPEDDDTESCQELPLGELRATLIRRTKAEEEGFPLFDLFDQRQEISDLTAQLFEPDYDGFVEPIREAFPCAQDHLDILFIRELELQPYARGQRVGVSALHRFMTDWDGGCSFVVMELPEKQLDSDIQDGETVREKLENHFRGLGFTRLGELPYLLLSPEYRQPPTEELVLENSMVLSRDALESFR